MRIQEKITCDLCTFKKERKMSNKKLFVEEVGVVEVDAVGISCVVEFNNGAVFSVSAKKGERMELAPGCCSKCGQADEFYSTEVDIDIVEVVNSKTMVVLKNQVLAKMMAKAIKEHFEELYSQEPDLCEKCSEPTPAEKAVECLRQEDDLVSFTPRHQL